MNFENEFIAFAVLFVVLLAGGTAAGIMLSHLARKLMNALSARRNRQSGNVFLVLFGAVAIAGMIGTATMQTMKGPVKALSGSNHVATATNDLYAAARLLANASQEAPDCDADGLVEPPAWRTASGGPAATGGGLLPQEIGAVKRDPWGSDISYCVWDHGSRTVSSDIAACGGASPRPTA